MPMTTVSRHGFALLVVLLGLVVPSSALALSYPDPAPMPGSPPAKGGLPGGEPSFVFDPSGDGHAYVAAPGGDGSKGVGFWSSADGARTFSVGRAVGSALGGGDSEVEVGADHTVYAADLEVVANAICRSHDFGQTFGDNCETGLASDQAGPESDREWLTPSPKDANVLYLTYHDFVGEVPIIEKSTDGGSSFAPCGSILNPGGPAFSTFSTGGTDVGKPAIGRDETIYVPITEPGSPLVTDAYNNFYVAVSDGGCSPVFRSARVYSDPGASLANVFSFVALDGGGTVWAITAGKLAAGMPYTINVFTSRDRGATWSKPIVVNPLDQKAALFPAIAGGRRPGEAVVGWYGTETSADPNDDKDAWRYYGATTSDFGQHWDVATITREPFHYGAICTQGILCVQGGNRNLADFSSVGVDPTDGCSVQVFPGDPFNTPASQAQEPAAAYAARQSPPCGGSTAAGAAGPGSGGTIACRDRTAPASSFRGRQRATRRGLALAGRSRDRGCGPRGRGHLVEVEVAVGRSVGSRCRFLRPKGTFGPRVACRHASYLRAKGRSRWRFALHARLPRGHYRAWVRGIDAVGNVERVKRRRNVRRLVVR